jgi:curved DNA-binding protein CbpA
MAEYTFSDHYETLGIAFDAEPAAIKQAYRKLARAYHPDLNPEAELTSAERFRQITEAYEVLNDPIRKGLYDQEYRVIVLGQGIVYETVEDTSPPDTHIYTHKYTKRSKVNFPFFKVAILLLLLFQVSKMIVDAIPDDKLTRPHSGSYYPYPEKGQFNLNYTGPQSPAPEQRRDTNLFLNKIR